MTHTPLEKRVKRHVTAREQNFFAAVTPGLEQILNEECRRLPVSVQGLETVKGGVQFRGRLQACYAANLLLRTANRILMRIVSFKATGFRRLTAKIAEIPWELYIPLGCNLDIRVSSSKSRLYHSGAIEERFRKIVEERLSALSGEPSRNTEIATRLPHACLFVRALEDRFQVSLDSSGDLLYKRGLKTRGAAAPIRETTAAAALMVAGYSGTRPLLDPMCGAGTFSLEAALMARGIPPGWFRSFSFLHWPAFRSRTWTHMRKQTETAFRPPSDRPRIFASDLDRKTCTTLQETVRESGLSQSITVNRADFFDLDPARIPDGPGLVALNPPYGYRLGNRQESRRVFRHIFRKLEADFTGWDIILVSPERRFSDAPDFLSPGLCLEHGGRRITILTGTVH
jgi:putative N6-adenine-specific DNA methylase